MIRGLSLSVTNNKSIPILLSILECTDKNCLCFTKDIEIDSDYSFVQNHLYKRADLCKQMNGMINHSVFEGEIWGITKATKLPTVFPCNYMEFISSRLYFALFIADFNEIDFYTSTVNLAKKAFRNLSKFLPDVKFHYITEENDIRTRFSVH